MGILQSDTEQKTKTFYIYLNVIIYVIVSDLAFLS